MDDHITPDGRVFYWLANIPYTRKDGSETEVAVWHSPCVVCGAAFTIDTPTNGESKAFGQKHCNAHKLTRSEATARWVAAVTAAKAQKKAR